jgi:hypothetical protein
VFITISVSIVLLTQHISRAGLLAALFVAAIAPMAILLFLGVRSGRWRDADVSLREERKRFYPFAVPLSALGTIAVWIAGAPGYILRGGIITWLLLVVAGLINFWFKISLHTLFAAYCTVILYRVNVLCGTSALTLAVLVFWSRLFLSRHSFAETLSGAMLGIAGGLVTAWM